MHESQMHTHNSFLTLTYSDKFLPTNNSLDVLHWQLFIKRLRSKLHPKTVRFYHCGEYGEVTHRPHYHACLFGHDFSADRVLHKTTRAGNKLYSSPVLNETWGMGYCLIGDLTFESAAYVARYVTKKATGARSSARYARKDGDGLPYQLKPEYSTMSRRPGIGATWFEKFGDQVYPRDQIIARGHEARPPAYYDTLLAKTSPELLVALKEDRVRKAALKYKDETPERRAVRERVHTLKMNRFQRDYLGNK